ncbi:uncharacterized protein [Macrobrachium rosenbergii]|uniref:uncharacterized protein isoform X3 n=1 Tax=Macrobrachium rosenbergii TaxID=79674 RepID=UPI0034D4E359
MMTYKKPVGATDSFLRPSRRYHDFELESGINKKVNCLIAFAAVALIVAVAALSLAIMLLIQIGQNDSSAKIILPNNVNPSILIDENSESPDTLEHMIVQGGVQLLNTSDTLQDDTESPKQEPSEHTMRPPLKPTTPEESRERTEGSADGKPETPADCPLYPRPICPVGYVLRNTDDPCPRPVCHPGDDEEDNEGSGEECPEYPQPSCPSGYAVMQSEGPCRRFLCRKQVPQD